MRVIAGQYRHRALVAPPGLETRPILDRVKVALFDWLGSRLAMPGQLPAVDALDIFCGAGSLGIEALSRGVSSCAFVDESAEAIACLQQNLDALRIGPEARVYRGPAEYVRIKPPESGGFELIFLDPPYRLSEDLSGGTVLHRMLGRLARDVAVSRSALVVWRHDAKCAIPDVLPNEWRPADRRTWGGMTITLLSRKPEAAE